MKRIPSWIVLIGSVIVGYFIPAFFYLPVFVLGMIAAEYYAKGFRIAATAPKALMVLFGVVLLDTEYLFNFINIQQNTFVTAFATAIGVVFLVLAALSSSDIRNKWAYPLKYVGDISYSFYLVHFIVLLWLRFLASEAGYVVYILVSLVLSLVLAKLFAMYDVWMKRKVFDFIQRLKRRMA